MLAIELHWYGQKFYFWNYSKKYIIINFPQNIPLAWNTHCIVLTISEAVPEILFQVFSCSGVPELHPELIRNVWLLWSVWFGGWTIKSPVARSRELSWVRTYHDLYELAFPLDGTR